MTGGEWKNSLLLSICTIATFAICVILIRESRLSGNSTTMNSNNSNNNSNLKQKKGKGDNRPNIVVMFADNLGYNDIAIFGAPSAKTPNIDRIGMEGMKLNNWNSAASLCSASRAALMTGKYPVRTGIYPGVLKPDAVYGLSPDEHTLAEYLKKEGYATSIVGKWHLGQHEPYLPTNQGFDEWLGIPYHMSGGSLDEHICGYDVNRTMWLPLYQDAEIVEQPVQLQDLAQRYGRAATKFIETNVKEETPFFLYLPFSHVHQMCAPAFGSEQGTCQWASTAFSTDSPHGTFIDAVEEMDWVAGEVLKALDDNGVADDTLVIFTSDNGPWVAEMQCSGSKGPFEGRWLQENVDMECTACPHDYIAEPLPDRKRRCVNHATGLELDGVHCGADTGLGGVWEANLRMPALARWPGRIPKGTETMAMISTLDVVPTVLSVVGAEDIPHSDLDGVDVTNVLLTGNEPNENDRVLYFWRDGFENGPLPAPFGRFDVAAIKVGRIKGWFWTKSAHYNPDVEVHHDPPLLFDVIADPAEAFPLDPNEYEDVIYRMKSLVEDHKAHIHKSPPLTVDRDPKFIPCANEHTSCRVSRPIE
mmetsp:Transcript_27063/g.41991  ORF Transcript_27063/g.41991 Transcript_27063/m.41991 type:complete len:588 (+) Transcript_27063:235-1998(+)